MPVEKVTKSVFLKSGKEECNASKTPVYGLSYDAATGLRGLGASSRSSASTMAGCGTSGLSGREGVGLHSSGGRDGERGSPLFNSEVGTSYERAETACRDIVGKIERGDGGASGEVSGSGESGWLGVDQDNITVRTTARSRERTSVGGDVRAGQRVDSSPGRGDTIDEPVTRLVSSSFVGTDDIGINHGYGVCRRQGDAAVGWRQSESWRVRDICDGQRRAGGYSTRSKVCVEDGGRVERGEEVVVGARDAGSSELGLDGLELEGLCAGEGGDEQGESDGEEHGVNRSEIMSDE